MGEPREPTAVEALVSVRAYLFASKKFREHLIEQYPRSLDAVFWREDLADIERTVANLDRVEQAIV